jgi:hypothetical protein
LVKKKNKIKPKMAKNKYILYGNKCMAASKIKKFLYCLACYAVRDHRKPSIYYVMTDVIAASEDLRKLPTSPSRMTRL